MSPQVRGGDIAQHACRGKNAHGAAPAPDDLTSGDRRPGPHPRQPQADKGIAARRAPAASPRAQGKPPPAPHDVTPLPSIHTLTSSV